jgi:type VI secretion system protein ImpE
MTLQELLAAGRLSDAIAARSSSLRSKPDDLDARWELAVLLCFAGELDRAVLQLDALARQNAEMGMGIAPYRTLLVAEAERCAVHRREGQPLLPPDCPAHVEARLAALQALRRGDVEQARSALERAEKERPDVSVVVDGARFDDLRDYDDLLGPVLEVYAGGRYLWLPFERVRLLEIETPTQLVDLLWPRARLEETSGAEAHVHLPALYVGSCEAADERVRLGRSTEWIEQAGLLYRGMGQKTWLAQRAGEESELGLLQVRRLEAARPGGPAHG